MSQIERIGIDTSKSVFTLHCVDGAGKPVLRINLRRAQLASFFKKHPSTAIAMEACASSHHWARKLSELGHHVRLIPPQYVNYWLRVSDVAGLREHE
jgi:transposase